MKKVFLVIVVLSAVAQAQVGNEWAKVENPIDSPKYFKNLSKRFPYLIHRNMRRITGGQAAIHQQLPYQALLISDSQYLCGGSIISQNWILTAAHCLDGYQFANVHVGIVNPEKFSFAFNLTVEKTDFIIHEKYDRSESGNDIALIRLASEIPYNNYMNCISLPTRAEANENLVGKSANVSGFGRFSDKSKNISTILRYVELSIVANSDCEKALPGTIFESNICVGNKGGKSACFGDSGGPLTILRSDETPVLVGIVSYGTNNLCEMGYPDVYTRVHSFLDWIEAKSGIQIF